MIRRWGVAAVAAVVLMGTHAASAGAQGLLGGVGGTLGQALGPTVGPVTQSVCTSVPADSAAKLPACLPTALTYRFVTFLPSGNPDHPAVERMTDAVLGLPTPIDVDGDGKPDLMGTLQLNSATSYSLKINRIAGVAAALPARVEAVLADPTGALPRGYVYAGYDAAGSRAPLTYTTTLTLPAAPADFPEAKVVHVHVDATPAQQALTVRGGLRDTWTINSLTTGGDIHYDAFPSSADVDLQIATGRLRAMATAPSAVRAAIHVRADVDGFDGATQDVTAVVNPLPTSTTFEMRTPGTGQRTMDLTTPGGVANLAVDFVRQPFHEHLQPALALHADADQLPPHVRVTQNGTAIAFDADPEHQPPVAQVGRMRVAVGEVQSLPPLPDRTDSYLLLDADQAVTVAQVMRLKHVDVAVDPPPPGAMMGKVKVGAMLGGARQHFHVERRDGGTITADIADLPLQIGLTLDIPGGIVAYDGHGQTIDSIDLAGASTTKNLFGRARSLAGHLSGMGTTLDATFHLATDGALDDLTLAASPPIADAAIVASSAPVKLSDLPRGTAGGVLLRDTKSAWAAGGAVSGLTRVTYEHTSATEMHLYKESAAGSFRAQVEDDGLKDDMPRTLTAFADVLPHAIDLTVDPTAITVDYDGRGTTIPHLTLDGTTEKGFFRDAKLLHAEIDALPSEVHLSMVPPATGSSDLAFSLRAGPLKAASGTRPPVGRIELHAGTKAADLEVMPEKPEGVVMRDSAAGTVLAARALDVRRLSLTRTGATVSSIVDIKPGPVSVEYADRRMRFHAVAADFPAHADVELDTDDMTVDYTGTDLTGAPQKIASLTFDGFADGGFAASGPLSRARYLDGHVESVPSGLHLAMKPEKGAAFEASSFVDVTLRAASSQSALELPPAGRDGVVYRDVADRFAIGARVRGLLSLHATLAPTADGNQSIEADATLRPHPLSFTVERRSGLFGSTLVQVDADGLPAPPPPVGGVPRGTHFHALFDPSRVRAEYDASGTVTKVKATATTTGAPFFAKAKAIEAVVDRIPEKVDLFVIGSAGDGPFNLSFEAPRRVGEVRVRAAERTADLPKWLADGEQGIVYNDRTLGPDLPRMFGLDARVIGLKQAGLGINNGSMAGLVTAAATPVRVHVYTDHVELFSKIGTFPGDVHFSSNAQTGKIDYTASGTIGTVDFSMKRPSTEKPLAPGIWAVGAHVEQVPAALHLTYATGGATGYTVDAGAGLGLVEVSLGQFVDHPPPAARLAPGVSGAVYDDNGYIRSAFARLRGLRHVELEPSAPHVVFDATSPQPVHVDADAVPPGGDKPGVGERVQLTGDIRDLPSHIEINSYDGGAIGTTPVHTVLYKASTTISSIELHARHLPGVARSADLVVKGVPTRLAVEYSTDPGRTAVSFDANGKGLKQIDADIRSDGGQRPLASGRNQVVLDDTSGMHASARIYDLYGLAVSSPLSGQPADSFSADVGFATVPKPLDVSIDHPLASGDVMRVRSTIEHPPQGVSASLRHPKATAGLPIELNYSGTTNGLPVEIPLVDLKLVAGSVGFVGTLEHIPGHAKICFDKRDYCGPHVGRYTFLDDMSMSMDSQGTAKQRVNVNGRLCLHTLDVMTIEECRRFADDFVDFHNFRFGDFTFEQGTGHVPLRDPNGHPYDDYFDGESDIGHLGLNTDLGPTSSRGVTTDRLEVMFGVGGYSEGVLRKFDRDAYASDAAYYDDAESATTNYAKTQHGEPDGSYVLMRKPRFPLRGHRWALTYDPPPIGLEGVQSGKLDCTGGDWDVILDFPGFDLAGAIAEIIGCAPTEVGG